jgi:formylglycine-generating enzyme required for sulfatase activity
VLYEMVTAEKLYDGNTLEGVIKKHFEPPDLRNSPKELRKILKKALAKDPKDRYENISSFMEALADVQKENDEQIQPRWKTWAKISFGLITMGAIFAVIWQLAFSDKNLRDGAELLYVPAGKFIMGIDEGFENESPEHSVYVDDFWIYKSEVSNKQFRKCIDADICAGNPEDYPRDNFPAVNINWYQAQAYCQWTGGRLPTEAEWEKAARGTDGQTYPWGESSTNCDLANYSACVGSSMPLGSYPDGVSPYGALDMVGNVWEWVADWYEADYYNQENNTINPQGPEESGKKVLRGGSWGSSIWTTRATSRNWFHPDFSSIAIGFRCVHDNAP